MTENWLVLDEFGPSDQVIDFVAHILAYMLATGQIVARRL
jgi:hypothetical protein